MRKVTCVLLVICLTVSMIPTALAASGNERYTMHWTTENCPYGNASDYTELVWTNFTPSVPIEYALQEFAFEQLQTLIAASLGVPGTIAAAIAGILHEMPGEPGSDITEYGLSFKLYRRVHKTEGYYVPAGMGLTLGVEKVTVYCYTGLEYTGDMSVYTYYDCASYS